MNRTIGGWFGARISFRPELLLPCALGLSLLFAAHHPAAGQAVTTTTVQGTVYLANGQVGSGTVYISWPAFTTAAGQSIAADNTTVTIAPDGFLSVNLAPNLGALPAGLYYTAVYYLGDGTTTTQYWVIPAAASASLAQVQAQLMPAAQAVQAVSKAYVDEAIAEAELSQLSPSGGTLTGPLYLSGDPTQPLQAADKHYVDITFAAAVPIAGGNMTGPLQTPAVNGVQSPLAGSAQTTLQAAVTTAATTGAVEIPPTYAGTDTFTNPNGVYVNDLRTIPAQQQQRGVKEFGAVCDGVTDDTNALQAALNDANAHSIALTLPQGTCKTQALNWRGESIGGMGKAVSALLGFPGQDVLASVADSATLLAYTHLHDLTIYVDQSVDVSCSPAAGRAPAGTCAVSRLLEKNSIFSPDGNGFTGTAGTGAAWAVGNCAIAMPASTGLGGNGLRVAEIENLEIAAIGADPLAAQYPGAHSTHTCGLYLAQWPQWSEFRSIDIRGLNTGIAIPPLPVSTPAGLNSDSNRWQNLTIAATHAFAASAGSNNVLDNVVAQAGNSAATAEPPTGLVLDFASAQTGWTVRNAVVLPTWTSTAQTHRTNVTHSKFVPLQPVILSEPRIPQHQTVILSKRKSPNTDCHSERTGPQTPFSLGVVSRRIRGCSSTAQTHRTNKFVPLQPVILRKRRIPKHQTVILSERNPRSALHADQNSFVNHPVKPSIELEIEKKPRAQGDPPMRMLNEFEAQVLSDLSVLKTQMSGLTGDGNGGRIADLERRMERHEQNWQRAKGFLAAMSVLFAVIEVAVEAWRRH